MSQSEKAIVKMLLKQAQLAQTKNAALELLRAARAIETGAHFQPGLGVNDMKAVA